MGPAIRDSDYAVLWQNASKHFDKTFYGNEFGHICDVCDRLWFKKDLKCMNTKFNSVLVSEFPERDIDNFQLCNNCWSFVRKGKLPALSKTNGFQYPPNPTHLPQLEPITERLLSPRLRFMQIRRLRCHGSAKKIVGQVINVPCDVDTMVRQLPRQLDDDYTINVDIKRSLLHKSSYLSVVKGWLRYLIDQPLYKHYQIKIDWSALNSPKETENEIDVDMERVTIAVMPESEVINARQHTMLWNEEHCLDIAPGQHSTRLNFMYDTYAERLSFPSIYYGVPRQFKHGVTVTPYMMANSETRRSDRRGLTPDHILYMAMKIMRLPSQRGNLQHIQMHAQHRRHNSAYDREPRVPRRMRGEKPVVPEVHSELCSILG
jgi:hypothetical protein